MKTSLRAEKERGLTLVELLVIIAVVALLAFMVYPGGERDRRRAMQVTCMSDLKEVGLADRVWEGTNGGTSDFRNGLSAFRLFQVMSNQLQTPKPLFCPADSERIQATTFNLKAPAGETPFMSNSNVSYFVGLDANERDPQSVLTGDRNITNGTSVRNGILELTPSHPGGWTDEMHRRVGNVVLADGSVQQERTLDVPLAPTNAPSFTNRLLMPVLDQ